MRTTIVVLLALLVAAALGHLPRAAAAQRPATPPLLSTSLNGREIFQFYCASCHGTGGRGDGAGVSTLKLPPPDLTSLAARNGSVFPTDTLRLFVAGESRLVTAHGSKEMPVWGPIFRTIAPRDPLTPMRIANVVGFIETLQKP